MKILVTGAAGFIGSHVARRFASLGHQVVAVDDFSNGFADNVDPRAEFIEFDLADPAVADVLPKDIEIICHLAGQASGENSFYDPIGDLDANAASTLNLPDFFDVEFGDFRHFWTPQRALNQHVNLVQR